jgi:hypothetical protein
MTPSDAQKELRKFLNPTIQGKNTDAVLAALSTGAAHLISNIEAVNDSLYIVRAEGAYLDARLADRGVTRPDNVGLADDIFRKIGIEISTRKQIRDLILSLLEITFGEEFTRATSNANSVESYQLVNGDTLIIQFDDQTPISVVFSDSQFANIATATAQEVADAITKQISILGGRGSAYINNDGLGNYVVLISNTTGPASSVRVVGGSAQNQLRFNTIRPTTNIIGTQWTLTQKSGGIIRATWTGGANPSIGIVQKNDYVNIYGSAFNIVNRGSYKITAVKGGLINNSYVEFVNTNGIAETITQGTNQDILFFNPEKLTLASKTTFAAAYQTEARLLEVFIPATTKVVRRDRIGSAHVHGTEPSGDALGPYCFDLTKPYIVGAEKCNTTQIVDFSSSMIITVDDSSLIPDESGFIVFDWGTSIEEAVPYIARPSSTSLMLNPTYKFKYTHNIGSVVNLIKQNSIYDPESNGTDMTFYVTDVVAGRTYAQSLIELVAATGINLVITIMYPNDLGLGKAGTAYSEKTYVWGN